MRVVTGVGSVFMFHSRCFLEKTRLSPATTDTHCPLPTPPPGGCFAELIYPGCLAPPGRRKTGDRGAGVERLGRCRGRPAGARWQEHGKAPRSTPGPRAGRPRAGRGVGAREAAVCSLHCPPRPGATTAPSANVSVERRSHPHPRGKIREGRAAAEGGGGGVASHWRFFDHHFMPDQLPPRAPRAQESPCATPRTQPSSEAEEKAEVLSRYRGPLCLRGGVRPPPLALRGPRLRPPESPRAPGAAADLGTSLASPGPGSRWAPPQPGPERAVGCSQMELDGVWESRGSAARLELPWLRTCPGLPAPAAALAAEPGPEPAACRGARPRPPLEAGPDAGRSLAGHWLGSLFRADFEDFPPAFSARPGLTCPLTHTPLPNPSGDPLFPPRELRL